MTIRLDKGTHTYTNEHGVVLPGVTTILAPIIDYSGVPPAVMEAARQRGNEVHLACELYLWDMLDEDSLDPEYKPYLDGFKLFVKECNFQPALVEQIVYHKVMGYAGTLDLAGTFAHKKKEVRALIYIKSTFRLMDSTAPQTWAYREAHASEHPEQRFKHRYGLRLTKEGKYQLKAYTDDMEDGNIFRACLAVHRFNKKGKPQ